MARRVSSEIVQSDLVLVLCLSGSATQMAPWVAADAGCAYAHEKSIRAVYAPPADPGELSFLGVLGSDVLRVESDDLIVSSSSPHPLVSPRFGAKLEDWIYEWVAARSRTAAPSESWFKRRFVKDITVFPDGYGIVRIWCIAEVVTPVEAIGHLLAAEREDPIPPMSKLQAAFASKNAAWGRKEMFNFVSVSMPELEVQPGQAWSGEPGKPNGRAFRLVRPDGSLLTPGAYEYEYFFGLKDMYARDYRRDTTTIHLVPVRIMEGTIVVRFSKLGVKLEGIPSRVWVGSDEQPETPLSMEPLVQENSLEKAYIFRSVVQPGSSHRALSVCWAGA